jgi:hypothetical protein
MGTEILYINRQRFVVVVVGKQKIKKIFVDETLLKINGQDYWLWLAYDEPNLHVCVYVYVCVYLLFHISREKQFLYAISSLDRDKKNKICK